MFGSKEWVMDLTNKVLHKTITNQQDNDYKGIAFKFGIDENGTYGYIKDGSTTITPFKDGFITECTLVGNIKSTGKTAATVSYTATEKCNIFVCTTVGAASDKAYSPTANNYNVTITGSGGTIIETPLQNFNNYSSSITEIMGFGMYILEKGDVITASCHSNINSFNHNTVLMFQIKA